MFPSHGGLDAAQAGEPGKQIFRAIEQKGVIPIAWGENGFRELTNSKRSIRRPEDLQRHSCFTPETGHWLARLARPKSAINGRERMQQIRC